jgi:cyanophycin synthetase
LTGGKRICPNGLIMLGHGRHQKVLDGTWSLDLDEDLHPESISAHDPDEILPQASARQIVERLFPEQQRTRMPVIAVTGTNGKTTTVLMIDWIMRHAGRKSGLVCSNGTYLDNRLVDERAACTDTGHLQVLTSKAVDIAVLETHHAGIMARGFCFDWCDIGVCTNVTNDHLGVGNINTIEQMAELKRAVPERARHAAVLNADDEHCLAMIDSMAARTLGLVSMDKDAAALQAIAGKRPACYCVLETIDGQEWLVLNDAGERIPLLAVDQVPASFDGAARFNVSNAMHAALSAYQAGIEPAAIAAALGQFSNDFNVTAGRMNRFDGLPFRVIMDYAHNIDGFRRLAEFVSRQSITGKKILMLNQLGDRLDEDIRASVAPLAGHFDHYVCRNYRVVRDRRQDEIPALLKAGLVAAGVPEACITTVPEADGAVRYSLSLACPGDLLVLLAGDADMASIWQLLNEMATGQDT